MIAGSSQLPQQQRHDRDDYIKDVQLEPAVLELDDETVIRTSLDVLQAGAAEGLIVTH